MLTVSEMIMLVFFLFTLIFLLNWSLWLCEDRGRKMNGVQDSYRRIKMRKQFSPLYRT
uniref:Uncharacterized protein n=1 Tax=Anguilla anguilla TaxID=7936 RepID=A0A0E9WX70_ANGAN